MQEIPDITANLPPYGNATLPPAIRSRIVNNVNGLAMHALEAGFQTKRRPCILLLHGFPELAYGWRKVMLPLAAAGYHVVAPAACATARQCSKSKAPLQVRRESYSNRFATAFVFCDMAACSSCFEALPDRARARPVHPILKIEGGSRSAIKGG